MNDADPKLIIAKTGLFPSSFPSHVLFLYLRSLSTEFNDQMCKCWLLAVASPLGSYLGCISSDGTLAQWHSSRSCLTALETWVQS